MKPKVYVETSILSYLTARPSNDLRVAANQSTTIEWWEIHRTYFEVFISEFVVAEAELGNPEASQRRLEIAAKLPQVEVTEEAKALASDLIAKGPIPAKSKIDAYHIAVAAVNGIEYLLTWNCKHMANAVMRPKIESICRQREIEPSIICTPQELMKG